jgi:hypothetical protein
MFFELLPALAPAAALIAALLACEGPFPRPPAT